jgi:glycosyltransferase involved in cell wall biosynthesis
MHFDIIMPTLGRDSLPRAIESIIQQRHKDWNLYIIGDGFVPTINFPALENKIYLIGTERSGDFGASQRNQGIYLASNPWIAYLDDDDVFYPDHLSTIVKLAEENPQANVFKTGAQEMKWVHKSPRHKDKVLKLRGINLDDPLTITLAHSRELFHKTQGWQACDNHDHLLFKEMLAAGGVLAKTEHVTTLFLR